MKETRVEVLLLIEMLVKLRIAARLSQEQLAKRIGIPQPAIARLESGRVLNPQWNTLRQYAEALDTDIITVAGMVHEEMGITGKEGMNGGSCSS